MREIKVKKLDDESFRKYGVYQSLTDNESLKSRSGMGQDFKPDMIWLNFGNTTPPTISVCHVFKHEKRIINFIEFHHYTCECLVPLDDDVIIYVGTPVIGELKVDNLEAFYVPKHTAVKLNPGVLHGGQYPVHNEEAHLICMLPGRTFMNDMSFRFIEKEEEQAIIVD